MVRFIVYIRCTTECPTICVHALYPLINIQLHTLLYRSLPGGKVDLGETTRDAAARELHEECSLNNVMVVVRDVNLFFAAVVWMKVWMFSCIRFHTHTHTHTHTRTHTHRSTQGHSPLQMPSYERMTSRATSLGTVR